MQLTYENIEQAKKDKAKFEQYIAEMKEFAPEIVRKTFKEMFGYEIIIYPIEFKGERFTNLSHNN